MEVLIGLPWVQNTINRLVQKPHFAAWAGDLGVDADRIAAERFCDLPAAKIRQLSLPSISELAQRVDSFLDVKSALSILRAASRPPRAGHGLKQGDKKHRVAIPGPEEPRRRRGRVCFIISLSNGIDRRCGRDAAGFTPGNEFDWINPPLASLYFVDE